MNDDEIFGVYHDEDKIRPANKRKEMTSVGHAGFRFFLRLGVIVFILIVIGASWGVASAISTVLGLVFTWIFWVCFAASFCLYIPYAAWLAYRAGVFDE